MKLPVHSEKVLDRTKAEEEVKNWRAEGERVVFTNGCFDILHPGHIDLLTKAGALGDRLIIGLNSDASVQKLEKGPGRPVIDQASRALLVASLEMVDAVVVFDEGTPLALIQSLGPDFLIKGADYQESDIVGKEHVEANGGQVVRLPLLEGYSSSSIIERIRNIKD
jgi:rfaE bifunctional protein nucleotidyltransferase chain/domain